MQALTDSTQVYSGFPDNVGADFVLGNRSGATRGWDGLIECAYIWDRVLTLPEALSITQNRYQIFKTPSARILPALLQPGVSGKATWVEQGETSLVSAAASIVAKVVITDENEKFSLTATATVKALISQSEQGENYSTSGSLLARSFIAWEEAKEENKLSGAVGGGVMLLAAWLEKPEIVSVSSLAQAKFSSAWVEEEEKFEFSVSSQIAVFASWAERSDLQSLQMMAASQSDGNEIDVSIIPMSRWVKFEGSLRIVSFEGSRRMVRFEGSDNEAGF